MVSLRVQITGRRAKVNDLHAKFEREFRRLRHFLKINPDSRFMMRFHARRGSRVCELICLFDENKRKLDHTQQNRRNARTWWTHWVESTKSPTLSLTARRKPQEKAKSRNASGHLWLTVVTDANCFWTFKINNSCYNQESSSFTFYSVELFSETCHFLLLETGEILS